MIRHQLNLPSLDRDGSSVTSVMRDAAAARFFPAHAAAAKNPLAVRLRDHAFRRSRAVCVLLLSICMGAARPARTRAQDDRVADPSEDESSDCEPGANGAECPDPSAADYHAEAAVSPDPARDHRARSTVTRRQVEERLPRSAPDALRFEPGVSIQQTAHGQASPYVRGLTGQQVVHVFDGVRMNNGIYRQGPNQYFFTVDSLTVDHIDVVRGSASVRHGSDALGGAILATPVEPFVDPNGESLVLHPRLHAQVGTADVSGGVRAALEARLWDRTSVLAGVGYRDVARLESGGVVANSGRSVPMVPRFEADGRTQLGTGFRELTFDTRAVHALTPDLRLTGAVYGYRELDAPRTDQCPPPEAPASECLLIARQFRTLASLALRGDLSRDMRDVSVVLSYQRHHERRRRDRPRSLVELEWRDDLDTFGVSAEASTRAWTLGDGASLDFSYGADLYRDAVSSAAWQTLTDRSLVFALSRGQYLEGSSYLTSGLFAEAHVTPLPWLSLRAGGRGAFAVARAPADPESGTAAVNRDFGAAVAGGGVEVTPTPALSIVTNLEQGFRAPNLDDLTSRQQTGPGFQFENPALEPERSLTVELGVLARASWLKVDAWAFATLLDHAMIRAVREADDCPPETPQCRFSRTQLQLINAADAARVFGFEGGATVYLPEAVTVRATGAWAWGDAPNTSSRPGEPIHGQVRVPLSRVPPLNGTVETRWRHLATGIYVVAALRWALAQRRLAPSDLSDARIPEGGTPGYAVVDLRAGIRLEDRLRIAFVFENVFDAAYRVHGSSINGPGRGLLAAVDLLW